MFEIIYYIIDDLEEVLEERDRVRYGDLPFINRFDFNDKKFSPEDDKIKYIIWQIEVGENGKPHIQGYVQFDQYLEHRCEECKESCIRIISQDETKICDYDYSLVDLIGPFETGDPEDHVSEEEKKRDQEILEDEMLIDMKNIESFDTEDEVPVDVKFDSDGTNIATMYNIFNSNYEFEKIFNNFEEMGNYEREGIIRRTFIDDSLSEEELEKWKEKFNKFEFDVRFSDNVNLTEAQKYEFNLGKEDISDIVKRTFDEIDDNNDHSRTSQVLCPPPLMVEGALVNEDDTVCNLIGINTKSIRLISLQ
ncbi:10215_t:CDS:2, partial [Funneliformis caledonium]